MLLSHYSDLCSTLSLKITTYFHPSLTFRLQINLDQPPSMRPNDAAAELVDINTHLCISEHLFVQQDRDSPMVERQITISNGSPYKWDVSPTTTSQPCLYNASDSHLIATSMPQYNIPQAMTPQLADKLLGEVEFDITPIPAAQHSCYLDLSSLTTVSTPRLSAEQSVNSPSMKGHRAEPRSEVKNFLTQLAYLHEYKRILKQVDSTIKRYPGNSSQKSSPVPKTILTKSSCTRTTASTWAQQDPSESQWLLGDASLCHGCSSGPVNVNITLSRCTELQDTINANQMAF